MRFLLLHGFTGTPESFGPLHVPEGSVAPVLGGHLDQPVTGGFWDEVERLVSLASGCDGLFGYSLGGRFALGCLPVRARYNHGCCDRNQKVTHPGFIFVGLPARSVFVPRMLGDDGGHRSSSHALAGAASVNSD